MTQKSVSSNSYGQQDYKLMKGIFKVFKDSDPYAINNNVPVQKRSWTGKNKQNDEDFLFDNDNSGEFEKEEISVKKETNSILQSQKADDDLTITGSRKQKKKQKKGKEIIQYNENSEYLRQFLSVDNTPVSNPQYLKKKQETEYGRSETSQKKQKLEKSEYKSQTKSVALKQEYSDNSSLPSVIQRKRAKSNQNPNILKVIHNVELMQKVSKPTRSYTILEDLKLIDAMSRKDEFRFEDVGKGFGPNFWINVVNAGFLDRALESVRDRVKRFIRNIGDSDIESIVHWVKRNNTVDAFSYFVGSQKRIRGDRFFSHVSKEDPLTTKKQKFSRRTDLLASESEEEEVNFVKKEEDLDKLDQAANFKTEKSKSKSKIQEDDKLDHEEMIDIDEFELKSEASSDFLSGGSVEILFWKNNLKNEIKKEEDQNIKIEFNDDNLSSNQEDTTIIGLDMIEQKQFEQQKLITYADRLQLKVQEVQEILYKINNNWKDLDSYLIDREQNNYMLWTLDEDNVLLGARNQFDAKFMKLRKIKGDQRIQERARFLQHQIPFLE